MYKLKTMKDVVMSPAPFFIEKNPSVTAYDELDSAVELLGVDITYDLYWVICWDVNSLIAAMQILAQFGDANIQYFPQENKHWGSSFQLLDVLVLLDHKNNKPAYCIVDTDAGSVIRIPRVSCDDCEYILYLDSAEYDAHSMILPSNHTLMHLMRPKAFNELVSMEYISRFANFELDVK